MNDEITERPDPLSPLVKGWIAVAAVVFFIGQELVGGNYDDIGRFWWLLGAGVAGVFVVSLLAGYLSWRFTRFVIDDEQVRVERRFILHQSQRIAFTKIQSVDVVAPFVARLLGLAALRIDVGSFGSATSIEFLRRERAYALRDHLIARAHGARTIMAGDPVIVAPGAAQPGIADPGLPTPGAVVDPAGAPATGPTAPMPGGGAQAFAAMARAVIGPVPGAVIVRVPNARLVASMLLSLELLVTVLVTVAVLTGFALAGNLDEILRPVLILPWLLGVGSFTIGKLRTEFNFIVSRTDQGSVQLSRGLTSLVSQTVPLKRVQGIDITQPLLWRPFGWYRMRLDVLGLAMDASEGGGIASTLLPVGTRAEVDAILHTVWPTVDLRRVPMRPIPRQARWIRWLDAQTFLWGHDHQVLVSQGNLVNRRTTIVPHARVQSVRLVQGPLQRRLGLASVQAHTTPGPVDLVCRHLAAGDARLLAMSQLDRMRAARQQAGGQ